MTITTLLNVASWHQRKADRNDLPKAERERHDRIAFRFFKVAHMAAKGIL